MAEGGATALAVEQGKVLLVDADEVIRVAKQGSIAVVVVAEEPLVG